MADTNITEQHRHAFEALKSGAYDSFTLFSCFCNGKPASAIVSIQPPGVDGNDEYVISPAVRLYHVRDDVDRPRRAQGMTAAAPLRQRALAGPYTVPRPAVVSFSGGRTSGYM